MNLFLSINEFNPTQLQRLRAIAGKSDLVERMNYSDDAPYESGFSGCDIVFGNVPPDWLKMNDRLRWIQLDSVGFGEYRSLDWSRRENQITMTNLAGFFAEPVAETALAGILSFYRGLDRLIPWRKETHWEGDPLRATLRSLSDARVVLFGRGSINLRLQQLLAPFRCSVTTFGRTWESAALDAALQQADILISTVPETDGTVGVFDKRRLELLGAEALFVNCGRGSVVDENALTDCLNHHRLGGAVIDVTCEEPLPLDNALWSTPNTLLTQHSGGGTVNELDRKLDVFAANYERYCRNQPLLGVVDFERGY